MLTWEIVLLFVKSLILCFLSITGGFSRKSRHWNMWKSSKTVLVLGPAQSLWYPRILHLVNSSRCRMCVGFCRINEPQPKTQRVDKQINTQGNLSLIPLPKIDEMYASLHGAKIFTTLDMHSGYYHISLDNGSKAKTAFVTPFCKYKFNAVPFGLAQAPAYFQQLISIVLQDCSKLA